MNDFMLDLRYAVRGIMQRPLFAIVAIGSIAIGIGANAAIFSVVNAMLLRAPAGITSPERAVEIGRTDGGGGFDSFSYPELLDIRSGVKSLDRVAGVSMTSMSFASPGGAERVVALAVSQPYFEAMGATPAAGRFFAPQEDITPGGTPVVVITHSFWRRALGGRADVIGSTINLNRTAFTVIGVTQPDFAGHVPLLPPDLFIPMTMYSVARPGFDDFDSRGSSWMQMVGRLAPNATVERASSELGALFAGLGTRYPEHYKDARRSAVAASIGGVPAAGRAPITAFLALLSALTTLVLLTTCANVAGMMVARATAREREIAIRLAIGSGRARLIRQLITESVVLFACGGAAGVMLSVWAMKALARLQLPVPVTLNLDFTADWRVIAYGAFITLLTGVLFGLAPALHAARADIAAALKTESSNTRSRGGRLRRVFVVAQVSLSVVLLVCGGLFMRSLQSAAHIDTGFDASGVSVVSFDLSIDGYDERRGGAFVRQLTSQLEGAAGITAAAVATDLPLDMGVSETGSVPEGADPESPIGASFFRVSPRYFDVMGMRIQRGRVFQESDAAGSLPVIVVSRAYAERAWPGVDAVGRRVNWNGEEQSRIVVGVVDDILNKFITDDHDPTVYLPITQSYEPRMNLLVKSRLPPDATVAVITHGIRELDRSLSTSPVQTLAGITSMGTLPQRVAAVTAGALGAVALLLSVMGVYGVIAYMVAQRTREIGIRVALGAAGGDVSRMVLRSGVMLALPGLVIGALAAVAMSTLLRSFMLGVRALDPMTFTAVPILLIGMVTLATWIPARRAARVNPMSALRSE